MKPKILAIDDDPSSLELVMSALKQEGVEILGASDPHEGLALFRKEQPEVVLLDLMMPKMNGIEVLNQISAGVGSGTEDRTVVIMLTAFGTVETAVEAMKAGAHDYLTKPIQVSELRLVVERALERVGMRAEIRRLRR
ncbi:MAG: response regulator, partial [Acidobacteriota bacterium]